MPFNPRPMRFGFEHLCLTKRRPNSEGRNGYIRVIFSSYTGSSPGPGSPLDTAAWFNALPPTVADKLLSFYYNGGILPGANYQKKFPFPGNGVGKIWMCPAVQTTAADTPLFLKGGEYGFFSYVMNLDLKLLSSIANGVQGNSYNWPSMPKLSSMRNASAQVLSELHENVPLAVR